MPNNKSDWLPLNPCEGCYNSQKETGICNYPDYCEQHRVYKGELAVLAKMLEWLIAKASISAWYSPFLSGEKPVLVIESMLTTVKEEMK
jgi:hypothetical protein